MACLLFNLALEKVVRDAGIQTNGTVFYKSVQLLAYADDIDIIVRSQIAVKEAFLLLEKAARVMGLKVNEEKTKYLTTRITKNQPSTFKLILKQFGVSHILVLFWMLTMIILPKFRKEY